MRATIKLLTESGSSQPPMPETVFTVSAPVFKKNVFYQFRIKMMKGAK
jgi:hypothetical protein